MFYLSEVRFIDGSGELVCFSGIPRIVSARTRAEREVSRALKGSAASPERSMTSRKGGLGGACFLTQVCLFSRSRRTRTPSGRLPWSPSVPIVVAA